MVVDVADLAPSNKKSTIHVLHVDDDPSMLEISKQILMDMGNFEIDHACCVDEALKKLATGCYDVVVSDYEMPQKDGLQFLKTLRQQNNTIPFILFTGKGREEVAMAALNLGADGYYNKQGNPETVYGELCHFLRSAVEKKVVEESFRKNEETLKAIIVNAPIGIAWSDSNKFFLGANEAFCRILGFSEEELRKLTFKDITHPDDANESNSKMEELVSGCISFFRQEKRYIRKDGTVIYGKVTVSAIRNKEGEPTLFTAELEDTTERVKAEEVLRESEESFRSLIDSMDDLVFVLGFDGIFKNYHQSSHKKELFVPPEEFIGKHFLDVLPPQVAELCQAAMKRIKDSGETQEFDYYMEMNGEKSWYNARLSPTKDQSGQKTSATIVVRNITERKKAEEALRDSEEKHRKLYEESLDAIFLADAETGIIIDCNKAALELVGRTKSEIVGQHQRILHPAHEIEGNSTRVFKQHQKQEGVDEGQVITKTGEIKDVSIKSNHVVVGDRKMLQGVFRDVTESKKAQNALLVSEEKYRETIQNANIGVVAYRSDGEITILNSRMQKMTGYTIEEVPSLIEWFGKLYPNEVERQKIKDKWFKKLTEVGEVRDGQATIVTKQGEERICVFDGFRLHSGDFIAFARDITELKKIEAHRKVLEGKLDEYSKHLKCMVDLRTVQLKDANERLVKSERLAAIGELAGMVGHDLRNPLAGIKNAAYFLKKKGTTISEAQNKEMLETIDKALEHSDKIINDLLDYAREMCLELTKYSAYTLVDDALRMIQVPNRIQIINNVQEDTLIWVNADKLIRVFINLIKNAIDAMPQKGTLRISSCQTKDCVEISFADTGTGIPEETLKKLFTPLFTTKAQGMGFGLAICKRIIEAHEGNINVKTELNKGTTFTVTLPHKPKVDDEGKKHA